MRIVTLSCFYMIFICAPSAALPQLESIVEGVAVFERADSTLQVSQESQFLHVQYESFDIGVHEKVSFLQPNKNAIAVNQVLNSDPTQIFGQLSANGQLFILAPGGLVIHDGATIEAASFFASTLAVDNIKQDEARFSSSQTGITNNGKILIEGGGYLQLLSNTIVNTGTLNNNNGGVGLTTSNGALIRFSGDIFAVEVTESALDGVIENSGLVSANAGNVELNANVRHQLNKLIINNQGDIKANSIWQDGGDIYIGSNEGDIENHGLIESTSYVNTNSENNILIESNRIANFGIIKNNSSGTGNAGRIELLAQDTVVLMGGSEIEANADIEGDGGFVRVFSPDSAIFRTGARIEAQAGFNLGDGGFVDVSGWQHIEIQGRVSTLAPNGRSGEFLIDPYNITISNGGTANQDFNVIAADTYTSTGTPSNIFVDDLTASLRAGNVTVATSGGGGAEAGNITISSAIDLDGTNGNILQFTADGSINIDADIKDQTTGTPDITYFGFSAGGNISIADGVEVNSGGGVITMGAGGTLTLSNLYSGGATMFLTAVSIIDAGDAGSGYDINSSGGVVSFNITTNIGGTSFTDAIEIADSNLSFVVDSTNQNVYIDTGLSTTDLVISSIDYDGGNGLDFNIRATNGASIIVDGTIDDSNTGSVDVATFNIATTSVNGDFTITNGNTLRSRGGDILVNVLGDASLSQLWSDGGAITITADNIIDVGTTNADINTSGGLVTLNASGNIGSTAFTSAIEINDSIVDIVATGTNQNVYIVNNGSAGLTVNDVDYDGTGTYNFNVRAGSTGDLTVTGQITDSTPGSVDVATINLETTNAASDIIIADGTIIRSYGGDITYNSAGAVGIVGTQTDGGTLNITATDVYDNGTGTDINTQGGLVTFNVSGDIGISGANGQLEVQDSAFTGVVGAANATWDFKAVAASTSISLSDIDFDGATGFTLSVLANGGDIFVTGNILDSNTGTADSATVTLQTTQVGGNITTSGDDQIHSYGGDITYDSAGSIALPQTFSFGGAINLTAVGNISDAYAGPGGYDLSSAGGVITINAQAHVGGPNTGDALEVFDSIMDLNLSQNNQIVYLSVGSGGSYLNIRDVDYDGGNGLLFNVRASSAADIILSGTLDDSNTGTVDSATFNIDTSHVDSDLLMSVGSSLLSQGANITVNVLGDASLNKLWSGGGIISITADNIINQGSPGATLHADGALITLNPSGDVGGTDFTSAVVINDAILDIVTTGTTQNVYIINSGAADLTINDVDYDGTGTFDFNVRMESTADLIVSNQINDSTPASTDVATIYLETQNASSNIILNDGTGVKSYGGDITYISAGFIGLANTETSGGALNLTAINDIYDNSTTNVDIQTDGGLVTINASADVGGVTANGAIEVRDSIFSGTALGANSTWGFRANTGSTYNELGTIDYNGTGTFTLTAMDANGGELRVSGSLYDSNTASSDVATINLETSGAGGDIVMAGSSSIESNGGVITYTSADEIGLGKTVSAGGAINITAIGRIYDKNTGTDLNAGGGLITITTSADVGGSGSGQSSAIEISDSILDMNVLNTNQNVYLGISATDSYLTLNKLDYNGGSGLIFDVLAENGSDIVVAGDLYDSDTGSADSATFNLVTNSVGGDISINSGSTIRSGDAGSVSLNSANDMYLTGIFGGAGGTVITAANDIIDNGDVTRDVQSSGALLVSVGRHVADADALEVVATSVSVELGTGNHNFILLGDGALANIEVDGANGANLSVLGTGDIALTGSINDANGVDDRINLTLGTSSPGFVIFPDAGYTIPGSLTFWAGTAGIKDSTDERVSITADSVISTGNNFLLNTGPIIFDLSVDSIDFNDSTGSHSFEIYNDKNLTIQDLDSDGEFLVGKNYKLSVNGDLNVPAATMNDVDDQLWLIADDIDDPDADNIITIRDSADAGNDFNLVIELTGANDVQINNSATVFDGTVAAGGVLTFNQTLQNITIDLGIDLNNDGSFIGGAGDLIINTASGGNLLLADSGLSLTGNLTLNVGGHLSTQTNQAINVSSSLLYVDVPAATSGLVFGLVNSADININTNESITLNGGALSTTGNIFLQAADITADTGRDLTLSANQIYLGFDNQLSGNSLTLTAQSFDASGGASLVVTNSNALQLTDLNGDGLVLAGFSDLDITAGGALTLDDVGLTVAGDMSLSADYIVDTDNLVALSATRLFVDYTSPLAVTYGITGTMNEFNSGMSGDLQVSSSGNISISDWRNDGFILNGLQNFELLAAGDILLPSTGLISTASLWLQGASISDGDSDLTLNAASVFFDSTQAGASFILNTNATQVDVRLTGSQSNMRINASSNLQLVDLNSDGDSLIVADGYAWVDTEGALTVTNSISVTDAQNDGQVGGWLYLGYQGQANIDAAIVADGSLELSSSLINPYASAQVVVRQEGALQAGNVLQISAAASVNAIGGDVVLDITNDSGDFIGAGSLAIDLGARVESRDQLSDTVLPVTYSGYVPAGDVSASDARTVNIVGLVLEPDTPIVMDPIEDEVLDEDLVSEVEQALKDAVKDVAGTTDQAVATEVQQETVAAVESSPNVNFALNEMFSECKDANQDDSRCKVKDEISRFLGRFLMGGSMPKTR